MLSSDRELNSATPTKVLKRSKKLRNRIAGSHPSYSMPNVIHFSHGPRSCWAVLRTVAYWSTPRRVRRLNNPLLVNACCEGVLVPISGSFFGFRLLVYSKKEQNPGSNCETNPRTLPTEWKAQKAETCLSLPGVSMTL